MATAGSIEVNIKASGSAQFIAQVQHAIDKLNGLDGAGEKAASGVGKAGDAAEKTSKSMSQFEKVVAAAGAAAAALGSVRFAENLASAAQSADVASAAFRSLGGNMQKMRDATGGMIGDFELAKRANLAQTMGINNEAFLTMAKIAQASAAKTGQSMSYLFESIIVGTARQSKLILDNLGILINVDKANQDYGKSIGVAANALNDAQQKQAFMNAVMAQGDTIMGEMARSGIDLVNPFSQFSAQIENASNTVGHMLIPAFRMLGSVFSPAVTGITAMRAAWDGLNPNIQKGISLITAVVAGAVVVVGVIASAGAAVAGFGLAWAALGPIMLAVKALTLGSVAIIGAKIIALVAVASFLAANWEAIWKGVTEVFKGFTAIMLGISKWFSIMVQTAFLFLADSVLAGFQIISKGVVTVFFGAIKLAMMSIDGLIKSVGLFIKSIGDIGPALGMSDEMADSFKSSGESVIGSLDEVMSAFDETAVNAVMSVEVDVPSLSKSLDEAESRFAMFGNFMSDLGKDISNFISPEFIGPPERSSGRGGGKSKKGSYGGGEGFDFTGSDVVSSIVSGMGGGMGLMMGSLLDPGLFVDQFAQLQEEDFQNKMNLSRTQEIIDKAQLDDFSKLQSLREKVYKSKMDELAYEAQTQVMLKERSKAIRDMSIGGQVAGMEKVLDESTGLQRVAGTGLGGTQAAKGLGQSIDQLLSGSATMGSVKGALVNGFSAILEKAKGPVGDAVGGALGVVLTGLMGAVGSFAGVFTQVAGQVAQVAVQAFEQAFQMIGAAWKSTGGEVLGEMLGDSPLMGAMGKVVPVFGTLIMGMLAFAAVAAFAAMPLIGLGLAAATAYPILFALAAAILPVIAVIAVLGAGIVALGMGFFTLATKTKSFERFQSALSGVSDRMVKALEPFFTNLMPLAGVFDALVSVAIPLADAFANTGTASRILFEAVKFVAIVFGTIVLAVGYLVTALLAGVIGVTGAMSGVIKANDFITNSLNVFGDAVLTIASAIVGWISNAFGAVLPQSIKDMLNNVSSSMASSIGSGVTANTATSALDSIASAARGLSPDIEGMGAALAALTGLTYEEAGARASILAREKEMGESLTNIPQGFKVAAARLRAITADSYGTGALPGEFSESRAGRNFIIDKLIVQSNNPGEMASALEAVSERQSLQQTGTTATRDALNNGR